MIKEHWLPATPPVVWAALHDTTILADSMPGCETLTIVAPNEYALVIAAGLGPIKARFDTRVSLRDTGSPTNYILAFVAEGIGGARTRGEAHIHIKESGAGTKVSYTAVVDFESWAAPLVEPLIRIAADKMAADFFGAVERNLKRGAG
jgi:carbon monoxide dehydrogenase subunit G